jgi:hypothetical protein
LLVAAACAAAVIPATGAASAKAPDACDPAHHTVVYTHNGHRQILRHMRTVIADREVWVARTRRMFGAQFFACWKPAHRVRLIGANSGGAATTDALLVGFAINGRYVAYHVAASGDDNYDVFASYDGKGGRTVRTTGRITRQGAPSVGAPLVVTSRGAIAFIEGSVLEARDAAGSHQLANEADGAISGLRAIGATVVWQQGGQKHSAKLR